MTDQHFLGRHLCVESYASCVLLAEKRILFTHDFYPPGALPQDISDDIYAVSPFGVFPILANETYAHVGWQAIEGYLLDQENTPINTQDIFSCLPDNPERRASVRHLCQLFLKQFNEEVAQPLIYEKIGRLYFDRSSPDGRVINIAQRNLRKVYLMYLEQKIADSAYLIGDDLSMADLVVAAALCCVDYLGEIRWKDCPHLAIWYQRMKSRKSFSVLLTQRLRRSSPAAHFARLD